MQPIEPSFLNIDFLFGTFYDVYHWFMVTFVQSHFWPKFYVFMTFLSLGLFALCVFLVIRVRAVERGHREHIYHHVTDSAAIPIEPKAHSAAWEKILKQVKGDNPAEWKIAIIDADSLLDVLTQDLGYSGPTIGDRLKAADPGTFRTLKFAWQAHATRNEVVHEGAELNKKVAQDTIKNYEAVFKEFDFV